MYCTCCIEVFDSIDQTVTQDVKGLQRNHNHVLFPAMQFLPQLQCCPIRGKLTTRHAYLSRAPRLKDRTIMHDALGSLPNC